MDKKSKFIAIFMCIVTLSALIIFITNYSWFLAFISPMLVTVHYADIDLPGSGSPGLIAIFVLFFIQMVITFGILLLLSKIVNCFIRLLSYFLVLAAYIVFAWIGSQIYSYSF